MSIPIISLQRLPIYLNYLKSLDNKDKYISSGAIARALGMGEVLVRKDLAFTSAHGKSRTGYVTEELISALEEFLGCNKSVPAAIVGAGGLGCALLNYGGFKNYGINVVAAFDNDPKKVNISEKIYPESALKGEIERQKIKLAVICVPASAAQEVCDELIACGVTAILNFAPLLLKAPPQVSVRNIDVAANLAVLSSQIKEEL